MQIILGILAIAVIGGLVYMIIKKNKSTESVSNTTETKPLSQADKVYVGLLGLNINAREKALDEDCLVALERVVDKTLDVAGPINEPQNYSELTVSLNRMHSKYIPSILNPYIALDSEKRAQYKDSLIEKLNVIEKELDAIKAALEEEDTGKFEKMGRFIDTMFENQSDKAEEIFK